MSKYDDCFAETTLGDSLFINKSALDPLAEAREIVARDSQERELATILNGLHSGYLPLTVSVYGPTETGKMLTARGSVRSSPRATVDGSSLERRCSVGAGRRRGSPTGPRQLGPTEGDRLCVYRARANCTPVWSPRAV